MGILAFVIQRDFCCRKWNLFARMLPGAAVLAGLIWCAAPFVLDPYSDDLLRAAISIIAGIGLVGMLLGCVAAWVHYAIAGKKQNSEE